MSRSVALAHLVRQSDGLSEGVWAGHTLRSAFQPIYGTQGDRLEVLAYEGLLRAFRDGEPIPPMAFFVSIPDLDRMHVETLTRTLHLLNAAVCLEESASIFVNFNPSVFTETGVADNALRDMRLVLHEAGIDARRVVCEITEQQSASPETLDSLIGALRGNGFRIAVDDYGAADSDIARVAALKPDIVKFDAHWMSRLMDTESGFVLLKTMVAAFEDRGIKTVFEGIEEPWQIEMALASGVSMLQGFALARPALAQVRGAKADMSLPRPTGSVAKEPPAETMRPMVRSGRTFGKRTAFQ
ncbi:MAG: EAL domain-containing protein [Rhizobiaceae bacterium]|nr:EAL domain-containing protein [Rhizobiaceae bacterium]